MLRWDAAPKVESKNCGRTMGGAKKECDPRCFAETKLPLNRRYLFGKSCVLKSPIFAEMITRFFLMFFLDGLRTNPTSMDVR